MPETESRSQEVILPIASLAALRQTLVSELGADAAAHAMRRAGHAAGDAFFAPLREQTEQQRGGSVLETPESLFWNRLSTFFANRGWGRISRQPIHPGIGALDSADWAEAASAGDAERPSCFFTTGLLSNLLGQTADGDIGVLEVECRARGDGRCRFLFGGPDALQPLYEDLAAGRDFDYSLAELV